MQKKRREGQRWCHLLAPQQGLPGLLLRLKPLFYILKYLQLILGGGRHNSKSLLMRNTSAMIPALTAVMLKAIPRQPSPGLVVRALTTTRVLCCTKFCFPKLYLGRRGGKSSGSCSSPLGGQSVLLALPGGTGGAGSSAPFSTCSCQELTGVLSKQDGPGGAVRRGTGKQRPWQLSRGNGEEECGSGAPAKIRPFSGHCFIWGSFQKSTRPPDPSPHVTVRAYP